MVVCIICLLGRFDLMDSVGCECCMSNTRGLTSWQKPGTAGTFSISGTCSPCPSGTVADLDGATECAACAPGRGHLGLAVSGPFNPFYPFEGKPKRSLFQEWSDRVYTPAKLNTEPESPSVEEFPVGILFGPRFNELEPLAPPSKRADPMGSGWLNPR